MGADYSIVGGGIAGLVLARRLAIAGRSVTLIEASDRLGGAVARHRVGGIDLDAGAESFDTRGDSVADLAIALGLGNELVSPARLGTWLQPAAGAAVPLPVAILAGVPAVPLAADVIAVVGTGAAVRAQLDSVIPHLWARESLSVGQLVRRRMGVGMLERLVAPVLNGLHGMAPEDMTLDQAAPGLRAALAFHGTLSTAVRSLLDSRSTAPPTQGIRGGMARLVMELVADLATYHVTVELERRVDSVAALEGMVLLTTPLAVRPGRPLVLATLVVNAPALDPAPRGTGVLVARGAPVSARALTHPTAKWQWLREQAEGHHVLRLSYDEEPLDLEGTARRDAEFLLGVKFESVGDFARVEWLRSDANAGADGAVVAGETVAGPGIASVVAQANSLADRLLAAGDS